MSARVAAAERPRSEPTGFVRPEDLRRQFWLALKTAHRVTENPRQAFCRRVPRKVWREDGSVETSLIVIEMRADRQRDRASFSGLFHCGYWTCPLCGPKIAAERAADIALAITAWYALGGRVAFSTWTMRHGRDHRLADLLAAMGKSWTAALKNKTPRRLQKAYSVGDILKLETNVGPSAGWHPHRHGLGFLLPGVTDDQAHELDAARFGAWSASLERQGFGSASLAGHDHRVLDLGQAHERIGEYVAKSAGHELAAAGTKRAAGENRTALELLIDLGALGLAKDRRLWRESESALRGKRMLRWSPGLRERLLGDLETEKSDQEAADSNDGAGRVIAVIGEDTWRRVWRFRHPPSVLLSAAEAYDDDDDRADSIARYLDRHQLGSLKRGSQTRPSHTPATRA